MKLGYSPEESSQIVSYVDRNGKIEGAPGFKPEHLPIFDCSLAAVGGRSIAWRGHLKMMAAAQPFLSGAISKTINMPEDSTVEDIMQAYTTLRPYYPGGSLNALASPLRGSILRKARDHRLGRGLLGYLIPFATHAFVLQCQECASVLPSLLVFPMISTDFTPTP